MNLTLVTPEKAIKLAANDFFRQLLMEDRYVQAAAGQRARANTPPLPVCIRLNIGMPMAEGWCVWVVERNRKSECNLGGRQYLQVRI